MDTERPQLRLRAACPVNGRPGPLLVSPDATRVFVLEEGANWLTVLSLSKFQILRWIDLAPYRGDGGFLLAAKGDVLYCRGRSGEILLFDMVSERFHGAVACGGFPRGLAVLHGGRLAQVTVSSGDAGGVELLETDRFHRVARLDLPLPPEEGPAAVSPDGSLGAAILRRAGKDESLVACWTQDPLRIRFVRPAGTGARSVAFDPEGRYLYAACHGESEVVAFSVDSGNIAQNLRMAGRPFQVRTEPRGRTVWVLCESLGSLAIVDTARGTIRASLPLRGVKDPEGRLACSPEGKLAVVPAEDGVALLNSDAGGDRYGRMEDRLELGRTAAYAAWSPLGDEVFLSDAESGSVLGLSVDRGDVTMDDTGQYLATRVRDVKARDGDVPLSSNPLFPP